MQDFGQWLPQSQNTANICFTNILVPPQVSTSIETQARTSEIVSSEKESALFGNTNGAGLIEGDRDDAGSILGSENGAGLTEGIDLNNTPAPKSKRKKHRPKVLKEEKPSKTPKSTAPKLSKGKEEKASGKRKYVRKKTQAGQPPPEQGADSNWKADPKPVRRCLNFDEQYNQEVSYPLAQAQVTELSTEPKDYQQSVSSISQRNAQNQSACCAGFTNSSIYSSSNLMDNARLLPADNMQKSVSFDLNSCVNQTHECANFMNCHVQDFEFGISEKLGKNTLLEPNAGIPHKNVPDLNSSISLLQSMSDNFTEYLHSSPLSSLRQTQMANQMVSDHRMPENPVTKTQSFERSCVRDAQCFQRSCSRDSLITEQIPKRYNHRPTANIEGNSMMEKLDKRVTMDDYLRINTTPYRFIEAAVRSDNSHDSSHSNLMDTRREYNASDGAQAVFGALNHRNNGLAYINACHAITSEASYFPETYKRMRLENHDYSLDGVVDTFSTPSAYLSSNCDSNLVSAINSDEFKLADAQRLIAHEKSHASQRMISFKSTRNSMVKAVEMVQQHYKSTLPCTAYRDSTKIPEKQSRIITQEFTQSPNSLNNLHSRNVIERLGSHELQYLEGGFVLGSYLQPELYKRKISSQDGTQNSIGIPPAEVARDIRLERFGSPVIETTAPTNNGTLRMEDQPLKTSADAIRAFTNVTNPSISNDVLRNESNQFEVSPTIAVKPSEKQKTRGRPRKELKPGEKPKPRGRPRKEKVVHAVLTAKGDPLRNEDISGACGPHLEGASFARAVVLERGVESISGTTAPCPDPLDIIIQKIALLDINKSDSIGAAELCTALVPYKGDFSAIIPFRGNVKRKRSRAKVDLDPVTTLMWKLLMGPDMGDHAKMMDKDKEKWLDEERKIFQGRVDSFIARMHLVQGDRRFSPWKGSVVDSVVGVFLTQNVSDHLSSSAFMALAAKFPVKLEVSEKTAAGAFHTTSEGSGNCSNLFGDAVKLQGHVLVEEASKSASSLITTEETEGSISIGLFGSTSGDGVDIVSGVYSNSYMELPARLHESRPVAAGTVFFVESEDVPLEDVVSSQNSAVSSQISPDCLFSRNGHMLSRSLLRCTEQDFTHRNMPNSTRSSITYTELLQMQELKGNYCSNFGGLSYTALDTVDYSNVIQADTRFRYPSSAPRIASSTQPTACDSLSALLYSMDGSLGRDNSLFAAEPTQGSDFKSPIIDKYFQSSSLEMMPFARDAYPKDISRNEAEATCVQQNGNLDSQLKCTTNKKQIYPENIQSLCSQPNDNGGIQIVKVQNGHSNTGVPEGVASNLIDNSKDTQTVPSEIPHDVSKAKKPRVGIGKKRTFDWDILRKEVLCNHGNKERGHNARDSVDWEKIRQTNVKEISETIRERGMNNMLAERIKDFLNRLVRDHESIDLEWLHYVEPDQAKDYLLSIRGLGLKSAECVRLLSLHHMAFPVDTNVGRICVRLGWVPLQPLPESLQLHLLELYPMLENIQKYLWPRLCKLDQRTLYELHYQMITFGKVFCTKSKPNCNACPMRAECKHFASAFASTRLVLPGPEEKGLVTSSVPVTAEAGNHTYITNRPISQLEWNSHAHGHILDNRNPIIEEPTSPELEPESAKIKEDAIEDAFIDDPEEIPSIKLNFTEFSQNLKSYMQANNIEIEDADMSRALVAITPEAASIPTPKLKNVSRLRTEHQVYELPNSHPLLQGLDPREPDDPSPYLLSIWTPGETAQSTDAPKTFCNSQESGKLCESATCFSCNNIREIQAQKVRATILIPCRTAMRGSFPLNGTYFQVNEVFADHDTSLNPIDVQRSLIWNLPRSTVYFGTSIPTIFKGLSTEDIQHCFWRGFVCVRGFDRKSRAPRPLYARLHFPASKITRNKKSSAFVAAKDDE